MAFAAHYRFLFFRLGDPVGLVRSPGPLERFPAFSRILPLRDGPFPLFLFFETLDPFSLLQTLPRRKNGRQQCLLLLP